MEVASDGTWSWVADVLGYEHGDFVLTVGEDRIYGVMRAGTIFVEFQMARDGESYAREPDVAAYGGCAGHQHDRLSSTPDFRGRLSNGNAAWVNPQRQFDSRTVDVLLLYSPAVASRYDVTTLVNNATVFMNASFAESGVDASVRIVHYHEVSAYQEPNPMHPELHVKGLAEHIYAGTGVFSDVPGLWSAHDADIVHMLFDASKSPDVCGWAFMLDSASGNTARSTGVSGDECIGAQNVLAHEIGHNLGGGHDKHLETQTVPFSYSYGFSRDNPVRRTIMGSDYSCGIQNCSRLNRWAGPNVYAGGDPMGDIDADMVSALNDLVPVVAAYATPTAAAPGAPQNVDVQPMLCYELNWLSWNAASGTVGWYEVETSLQSNLATAGNIYRGPAPGLLAFSVVDPTYVRVRACNGATCGSWSVSPSAATYTPGCL